MKYVRMRAENGYCGCDAEQYVAYDDDATEEEIEVDCQEFVQENAESFSYLATGWDDGFEDEEAEENYYADCFGDWEYVTEEEYRENS